MIIKKYPYGPIEANCYLIETENAFVMIDPCVSMSNLLKLQKPLMAIIVTHCHYDHISCIDEIRNETKAPVYCHPLEFPSFSDSVKNGSAFFMLEEKYPMPDKKIEDLDIFIIDDNTKLQFLHTPGHTMGSICILVSENNKNVAMFTGDTLFQGSAGRTDLGGSPMLLRQSLLRLKQYDDSIIVYSGHGPDSTLGEEKRSNPFMW